MARAQKQVIVCQSIHDVTKAESRLRKASLWCDMIPMPREIASDCGMALMFNADEADSVVSVCEEAGVRWEALYAPKAGSYTLVRTPKSDGPGEKGS